MSALQNHLKLSLLRPRANLIQISTLAVLLAQLQFDSPLTELTESADLSDMITLAKSNQTLFKTFYHF